MSTIVTRAGKGSALTHTEVDANFTNLNTDKLQSGNTAAALTITSATIAGGTINGTTVGATTPSTGSFTSLTDSGNLTFTGTGNRITGDFSNATFANRVMFQTSTTNGNTLIGAIPNGTGQNARIQTFASSDPTNTATLSIESNSSISQGAITSGITGTGTYLPMTFYTGGSERMRIDTSGNLGIGTSSPSFKLDVTGNARVGNVYGTGLTVTVAGNSITYPTDNTLAFSTASTERARIDSSGNLLVGTTSNNGRITSFIDSAAGRAGFFMINAASSLGSDAVGISKFDNDTTTSQVFVKFFINNNAAASGLITANGANQATFTSSSDARLKENIVELPPQLANIMALRPVEFDYIESEGGGHQIGFVAQEVQNVYPDLVGKRSDEMLLVSDLNKNDARFIKAIQELNAKVETLQAEVAALKGA